VRPRDTRQRIRRPWQDAPMISFAVRVVVNAIAIWVATLLLNGVQVTGGDSTSSRVLTYLFIGLLFGIVNAIVKPVVKLLAFPFYILTLGLFTFVVNAAMLELTAWLSSHTRLTLTIDDFWWDAVLAALVVTIVSMLLNAILPDDD
jgi:putative membrane protein